MNVKFIKIYVRKGYLKIKAGDHVRLSKYGETFTRGYDLMHMEEIFVLFEILKSKSTTYKEKDLKGEEIKGSIY